MRPHNPMTGWLIAFALAFLTLVTFMWFVEGVLYRREPHHICWRCENQ